MKGQGVSRKDKPGCGISPGRGEVWRGKERLTLAVDEELPVLAYVFPPFSGYCKFVEDGIYRANRHAVGTVYASHRVYEKHCIFVGCVNAVHRAHINTSGILYCDARFRDDERHASPLASYWVFLAAKSGVKAAHKRLTPHPNFCFRYGILSSYSV